MTEPIKIILFKGPHCAACKPVARHLKRIEDTSQGGASLTIIDTDENRDIASKYGVRNVPHVLYDDEVILSATQAASMFSSFTTETTDATNMFSPDQYDLFNFLFNKLIEAGVKASESSQLIDRWRKLSIISVSERILNEDELESVTRPSVGDYVHIGHLQSIVTSLLAINPSAKSYLFRSGELAGKFGSAQSWIHRYNPKIMETHRMKSRFTEMLKGFRILYGPNPGATNIASEVHITQIAPYHARLQIKDSGLAVMNSDIGQDVCGFISGEIAGLLEVTLGEKASVEETKCWGLGDDYCEFDIRLGEESDHYSPSKVKSKEFFSDDDRLRFDVSLSTISRNMFDSILNRRQMRPGIGDYCHISVLQHIITSVKFSDPFNSTLLAYAGQSYGQMLEDVGSISRIVSQRNLDGEEYLPPAEFPQACELLGYYLNTPGRLLSRIHGVATVEVIDDESAVFKIWESAATSGIDLSTVDLSALFPGIEKPTKINTLDDFMAGFLNGRLNLLVEDEIIVRETKCQANGHPYCEFEAELD
ncbi:MAG: V4R domain-containing protein [Promethearchaeota archaeon]